MSNQKLTPRAQVMFPIIEKYLASGMTQRAFCQTENLKLATLQKWLGKYRETQKATSQPEAAAFITLPQASDSAWRAQPAETICTITYPHGVSVCLTGSPDAFLIGQLIQLTRS